MAWAASSPASWAAAAALKGAGVARGGAVATREGVGAGSATCRWRARERERNVGGRGS